MMPPQSENSKELLGIGFLFTGKRDNSSKTKPFENETLKGIFEKQSLKTLIMQHFQRLLEHG